MAFVIEKKLKNVMTFYYLMKLDKKIPTDRAFIRKRQGKKVHELMKRAYKIPFYRKRFDANHLTPNDFHTPEDLVKFPVTTRADLRLWMQEEYERLRCPVEIHPDAEIIRLCGCQLDSCPYVCRLPSSARKAFFFCHKPQENRPQKGGLHYSEVWFHAPQGGIRG